MNKKITLKRYVIHILAINAINADAFDRPYDQTALISCTDRTNQFLSSNVFPHKLVVPFLDVEIKNHPGAFNDNHAHQIIRFLQGLPEDVTDLYVCCSKGGSRSAALAAALLKASGRSDAPVWKNPFYVPNKLVYQRMCRSLGITMPHLAVRLKAASNARQYKKAKRRGSSGEFERWQLLE